MTAHLRSPATQADVAAPSPALGRSHARRGFPMIAGAVSVAGEAIILFGSLLILIAAVGVMQFRNVLSRMHALSKASTGGITIVLLGAAILVGDLNEGMSLVFAAIVQAATNPVSSTLLTQATYYAEGVPTEMDAIDDLATALDAREAALRDAPSDAAE